MLIKQEETLNRDNYLPEILVNVSLPHYVLLKTKEDVKSCNREALRRCPEYYVNLSVFSCNELRPVGVQVNLSVILHSRSCKCVHVIAQVYCGENCSFSAHVLL